MKIILHKNKEGITTEYYNETLKEVLSKVGNEGKLYLEIWHDNTSFKSAYIGDLRFSITQEDYYRAYDEVCS